MNTTKDKELLVNKMYKSTTYKKLFNIAKNKYESVPKSHDWSHILRVLKYCEILSKNTNAKLEILFASAILHDIARNKNKNDLHSESTSLAKKILLNAGYEKKIIGKIITCVQEHSLESNKKPRSIEAKILFDADKLDSYGAIGIARFFMLAGEQNYDLSESVNNAYKRIKKMHRLNGFYTEKARKIGLKKVKKALMFYSELFQELKEQKKVKFLEKLLFEVTES